MGQNQMAEISIFISSILLTFEREPVVLKEGSTGYLMKHVLNIVLVSTMYEGELEKGS